MITPRSGSRAFRFQLCVLSLGLLTACAGGTSSEAIDASVATAPQGEAGAAVSPAAFDADAAARFGEGFLVWESNRTGRWRIWTRRLDGTGLRQLTADEPRQHCCAHISPSGEWVTYVSLPGPGRKYVGGTTTGALRMARVDGSEQRDLVGEVRTHHENRAAVWRNDRELIYVTADGRTALLDVESGASEILIAEAAPEHGWLLNSGLTHATRGWPSFSIYHDRTLAARAPEGGCQPYFSHDGRWGFFTAGAGGPIHRVELATGEVTTLLRKNDPGLPEDRGYLYFPMVSRDGTLMALGASRGRHDHFAADYEIFVFASDPRTLEVRGKAVRYTFDPQVDRFPDVWAEPLELGDSTGEAPFEVTLAIPPGHGDRAAWSWDLGDGRRATGEEVTHRFERAGIYRVTAISGALELAGMVRVSAAAPPRVVKSELRRGGAEVVVWFDEEVELSSVEALFQSGLSIVGSSSGRQGRSLVVELAEILAEPDRLVISGVADRAQARNVAAEIEIAVAPPLWPADDSGLVFLWQTGDAANLVRDADSGVDSAPVLRPEGRAALDHDFAMAPAGGSFTADADTAKTLIAAGQRTNELTLEVTLTPRPGGAREEGRIISLGGPARREVVLAQRGKRLSFQLLSKRNRSKRWSPAKDLFEVAAGETTHVTITYRPGLLRAYRDGELAVESQDIQGDFFHWEKGDLILGKGWQGTIEGAAIYDRVLEAGEIRENSVRYHALRQQRRPVERLVVDAFLAAVSSRPLLEEISPYREALVVNEYRVERVISGRLEAGTLQVAEWAILGGESQPSPQGRVRLLLERFADNPQLEGVVVRDDLGTKESDEIYYAVP